MKKLLLHSIFLLTLTFFNTNCIAQINVTTGHSATKLAEMLVGTGVKILNATYNGVSSVEQRGKFFSTNGALPFDSGVVLSTGNVKTGGTKTGVNGNQSNNASFSVYPTSTPSGDVDLEWLLNNTGAAKTHDACVLEFDLIPSGDSINISYIFSSEEYSNWVCSQFNDVFGFFLTGFGIIGRKNLALVPNSIPNNNIPVSINSINNGIPSSGSPADYTNFCQATGVGAPYTSMYQPNVNGQYLTHYGRTKELVARYKVTPCKTYHLRLAIADFSDGILDSGIFLKAGSIKSEPQASLSVSNTYKDTGRDVLVERCHTRGYVKVERNKKLDSTKALTLNFAFGGTATYGVDYTSPNFITFAPYQTLDSLKIDIIDDGIGDDNEIIWIKILPPCPGVPVDSIAIRIREFWSYKSNSIDTLCYPSQKQIKSLFADSAFTSFLWNTGDTTKSIFATVSGVYNSLATYKNTCTQKDTFNITIDSLIVKNTVKNFSTCNTDSTILSYTVNQFSASSIWSNGSTDSIIKVAATGNYIMTCTSPRGCVAKDTSFIKYISNPILTLPPTINFCSGDSVLLTASTDLGLQYLWNTGDTTNTLWVKNSGTYSVVAQANGCIAYDTTVVTSKSNPSVSLPTNIQKCKGDSVWLNASSLTGSVYTWSNGLNTDSILVKTSGKYFIDINLNGCFAKDTSDIIFYDIPVLNLPATINFCAGDSSLLNATTFAGTQYLWNTADTLSNLWVKANGTYSVKATLGVCNAYDSTIVSVTQYPTLNLQSNISGCIGDSVLLDATNAAGTIYTWSNGAATPTIYIKSTNTYTVTANLNSCITKDTTVAIFNNTPVLNLASTKDICAGDSTLLNATTFAGTSYTWSTGETTPTIWVKTNGTYSVQASLGVCNAYDTTVLSVTQYPILNLQTNTSGCIGDSVLLDATNAAGTIYTWSNGATTPTIYIKSTNTYTVVANLNGCISKDTTVAIFNNTPVLNLAPIKDICAGDSTLLNATTFAGTSYTWSTGETTPTIWVKVIGTYSVKASLGVCDAYDTTVLTVTQYPILNLQSNISACKGDSILLDATNAVGTNYTWSNGATTPSIFIKNSNTYIIVANLNGCISKDTTIAIFNNTPILNLPPTKDICAGASVRLDATTFAGTSYTWSTTQQSPFIDVNASGTYFVKATLGVCNAYDTSIVTVTQYPSLGLPANISSCKGDSILLDATNAAGTIYTWNNGATTPTVWIKTSGTYTVVANLNGCISKDTAKLIFNNAPIINLQSTAVFCDGDSAVLKAISSLANTQYLWNTGEATQSIVVKTTGDYLVDAKANGCTTRDTTVVTVYPLPTVNAGQDIYVMKNDPVIFTATTSNDVTNYLWSPSFNLSDKNILQPTVLYAVDTTYTLRVYTAENCTAADKVKVVVLANFEIPNAFSPNGDGINDKWEIKGLENYNGVTVDIFDRYGRKVFSKIGYNIAWNGTLDGAGKSVPIGTYYYIIDIKRGKSLLTGSVTILR